MQWLVLSIMIMVYEPMAGCFIFFWELLSLSHED